MPSAAISYAKVRAILRLPNPIAAIKGIVFPEPTPTPRQAPQLTLWIIDGEGLPPRPWRIQPHEVINCVTLHGTIPACRCVARQLASDVQRPTKDTWRGKASDYPHCVTSLCAQGRGVREALDPGSHVTWRGAGPGGRFDSGRRYTISMAMAKAKQEAQGMLEDVPTCDMQAREGEG
jgi:hypothetical protein